jgi:hypothetical protein
VLVKELFSIRNHQIIPLIMNINQTAKMAIYNYYKTTMGVLAWIGITILGVIGFAVTGPVAGSLAAIVQSSVYGGTVAAGSWFAVAQSIAMAAPTP